ncbi:MAG: kinase [Eubacteriales bacterium]|nr:kinase [Eubacteriales bacterium]
MIITRTPFRMSFFGGGTDFESYFKEHGGAVLSTTFDKYCYVSVRHLPRFFDYWNEIIYSKIERVKHTDEIVHPAVRNAMKMKDMHELRLSYDADLPARSGLGTSSSFAVGMLNAFSALKGKKLSKRQLADEAIYLERVLCNESGGIQDQVAAAFGGLNVIAFGADGYEVRPVNISEARRRELNSRLMLFFTGFSRFSSDIQVGTSAALKDKTAQLKEMTSLVYDAERILADEQADLDDFGRMLDHTWKLKRGIASGISTDSIDCMYAAGIRAGALGGKLLGAGGGGFLVFYVDPEHQEAVMEAMKELLYIPFCFENEGTVIIHDESENYEKLAR